MNVANVEWQVHWPEQKLGWAEYVRHYTLWNVQDQIIKNSEKKVRLQARKMGKLVKCLLHKREDASVCTRDPSTSEVEVRGPLGLGG